MHINIPDFVYRLQEGQEIISPKVDFAFKKFFGAEENKDFLIDFLQSLLDIPKEEYDEVTFENTSFLKDYDKDKYGILDVLVKTKKKTTIHIEIQVGDVSSFKDRALYYLSRLVTGQMQTGKHYSQISKTISILVLNYELIHDTINYKNVYHFCDLQTRSEFSDKLEIITLELPKIPTEVSSSEKEKRLISALEFL